MESFFLGVLGGVFANVAYWTLLLMLSRPRIDFSSQIVDDPSEPGFLRVKVRNALPWSVQGLNFEAALVTGDRGRKRYEALHVRSPTQPILGGWAYRSRRRSRYGWLGASHRVVTIGPSSSAPLTLAEHLMSGDEIVVSVLGMDGALLSVSRWSVRSYRFDDLSLGFFESGRSLRLSAGES